jgi:MFS family permease
MDEPIAIVDQSKPARPAAPALTGVGSPVLLCVMGFLADVASGLVVVALPFAAKRLGADLGPVGLIGGLYMGGYAVACLLAGAFIDRFRPRNVLVLGQLVQSLAAIAIAMTGRLSLLYVLVGSFGMLMVTIWPPMMSWLTHGHEGATLNRRIGWFNVSWCSGLVIGPFLGGAMCEFSPVVPFIAAALVLALSSLLTTLVTLPQPEPHRPQPPSATAAANPALVLRHDARVFRLMARASVVVCTAVVGMQRFQVFSLAEELHVRKAVWGAIMAALSLANMTGFVLLGRTHRWHYRRSLLWGAQIVLAAATASLVVAQGAWHLAAVAATTGLCGSIAYSSSLYYGVSGGRRRAALVAIHEMLLSIGFVMGAIGSGELSQRFDIHTPYLIAAAMLVCAALAEMTVYGMTQSRRPSPATR